MLDFLELLFGILDALLDVGDFLTHWRICIATAVSAGVAYVLYHSLPWDTANAVISIITGLGGVVAGIAWEASAGSH